MTEFDNNELSLLRTACLSAALISGNTLQADEYNKLADKCGTPSQQSYLEKMLHLKEQLDNLVLSLEVRKSLGSWRI